MSRFELFQDRGGRWRFRLKAANGRIVAQSEAYSSKRKALQGVEAVKTAAADAETIDPDDELPRELVAREKVTECQP